MKKMKMKKFTTLTGVAVATMMLAAGASASTISVNPDIIDVSVGASFGATLVADFSDVGGTSGGGVGVTWDTTVLTLNEAASGYAADVTGLIANQAATHGGDSGLTFEEVSVNTVTGLGSLTLSMAFCPLFNPCESLSLFNIYDLVFDAVNPGTSLVDAVINLNGDVWWDNIFLDPLPDPTYVGASVTVGAVPVPPALWLFGSGLLGLVGIARRRKTQLA